MRKHPPALITIAPKGDEDFGSPKPQKVKGGVKVTMGTHGTITCWCIQMGMARGHEACIAIYYPQKIKGYIRTRISHFEEEIISIINHETLHHVLMWLADDPLSQEYDQIDNIVTSVRQARKLGL